MPAELTSTRSARVTDVRHLHDRRHRAERGAFVVEGPQATREALTAGITELYATEAALERHADIARSARERGARVVTATDEVLAAMSETRQPQGLLAVCPLVTRSLAEVLAAVLDPAAGPALLVVLDGVSDPGNAGTIIRSADAMGAGGVVFTAGSVDPHNGKCVRSTAGSLFHLPIATGASAQDVMEACQASGVAVVLADAHGTDTLDRSAALLREPLAWVFGSEAHGVGAAWRGSASGVLRIPMTGDAESLNLAAAAAICLYATEQARVASRDQSPGDTGPAPG
jgi:RNA methyltransferase, TrmH family